MIDPAKASDSGKGPDRASWEIHHRRAKPIYEIDYLVQETDTVFLTTTIKDVAEKLHKGNARAFPVVDAGQKTVKGVVTTKDVLNYFGGGKKHNIFKKNFGNNFLAAVNSSCDIIMSSDISTVSRKDKINDVIKELKEVDSVFILEDNKIVGRINELTMLSMLADMCIDLPVKNWMKKDVIYAGPNYKILDVCEIMVKNSFGELPVVERDKVTGIVTYDDLMGYFSADAFKLSSSALESVMGVPINKIMTKEVVTVKPDDNLAYVLRLLKDNDVRSLPVYDEKLLGIITQKDIMKGLE